MTLSWLCLGTDFLSRSRANLELSLKCRFKRFRGIHDRIQLQKVPLFETNSPISGPSQAQTVARTTLLNRGSRHSKRVHKEGAVGTREAPQCLQLSLEDFPQPAALRGRSRPLTPTRKSTPQICSRPPSRLHRHDVKSRCELPTQGMA